MNSYYVYAYYNSNNDIIYVGKGKSTRCYDHFRGRSSNKILKGKIAKGEQFKVEILYKNLTEKNAFDIEKNIIKQYGRVVDKTGCLYNLTTGGEGVSGYVYSVNEIERRYSNLVEVVLENINTGEIRQWPGIGIAARELQTSPSNIHNLVSGKTQTLFKIWKLKGKKIEKYKNKMNKIKIYDNLSKQWLNFDSCIECDKHINVSAGYTSCLLSGKIKHIKYRYTLTKDIILTNLPRPGICNKNQKRPKKYKPITVFDTYTNKNLMFESRKEAGYQLGIYPGDFKYLLNGKLKSLKKGRYVKASQAV